MAAGGVAFEVDARDAKISPERPAQRVRVDRLPGEGLEEALLALEDALGAVGAALRHEGRQDAALGGLAHLEGFPALAAGQDFEQARALQGCEGERLFRLRAGQAQQFGGRRARCDAADGRGRVESALEQIRVERRP